MQDIKRLIQIEREIRRIGGKARPALRLRKSLLDMEKSKIMSGLVGSVRRGLKRGHLPEQGITGQYD